MLPPLFQSFNNLVRFAQLDPTIAEQRNTRSHRFEVDTGRPIVNEAAQRPTIAPAPLPNVQINYQGCRAGERQRQRRNGCERVILGREHRKCRHR